MTALQSDRGLPFQASTIANGTGIHLLLIHPHISVPSRHEPTLKIKALTGPAVRCIGPVVAILDLLKLLGEDGDSEAELVNPQVSDAGVLLSKITEVS